ncbi:MAG: ATP-binding protein [Pseudomonadota bacterium]
MLAATVLCGIVAALAIAAAIFQPWLGVTLAADPVREAIVINGVANGPAKASGVAAGSRLFSIGPAAASGPEQAPIGLLPSDLSEDPDGLPTYRDVSTFMERQSDLVRMLSGARLQLHLVDLNGNATTGMVHPQRRPIAELPAVFWVQLFSGSAGLLIGVWVWALRRDDLGATMFALSGLGLFLSAMPAAVYSTRELAIDGRLFTWLSALNHVGAHLFGAAIIALFLSYPRRLVRPASLLVLPLTLVPWFVADVAHALPGPVVGMYVPMLMQMVTIVGLVVVQWRLARHDPVALAALRWLGLSVIVGAGAFTIAIAVPLLLGAEPAISQGYAFTFFVLVYAGIALGIRRYRLFELGDWAFRILFYAGAAAVLLAIDAALIGLVQLDPGPALAVSLLIVSFAYLPLRDALWRRMNRQRQLKDHEVFAAMSEVAFALTPAERSHLWHKLLMRLFDPLELIPAGHEVSEASAAEDGLELLVPAAASSAALRLRYPYAGKGLFGPQQAMLARQLTSLLAKAETSRNAYERGVLEERHRIARDLHDDVGARLLTGLNVADGSTRPILHAALSDIRAIISGLTGASASLDRILAEARYETANRLQAVGIELDWTLPDERTKSMIFDYRQSKALVSSVREIISNVIRHAKASRVCTTLTISETEIMLSIADDGGAIRNRPGASELAGGFGLSNIRQRVEELGGRLTVRSAAGGFTVAIMLPKNPARIADHSGADVLDGQDLKGQAI